MPMLKAMLAGAILLNAVAIALFFWRFWLKGRDPLFACFAVAFLLLGLERVAIVSIMAEGRPLVYLVRLSAFLLILLAVWRKNRRSQT